MKRNMLNEADLSGLTAAQLKAQGITSITGYGGSALRVNPNGYMIMNKTAGLPQDLFTKLQGARDAAMSGGTFDTNAFMSADIDGTPVKDILAQCPSQQSYGVAGALHLPEGTDMPCKEFTEHGYTSIKYGGANQGALDRAVNHPVGGGAGDGDAGAGAGDGGDAGAGDGGAGGEGGDAGAGDGGTSEGADHSSLVSFFGSKEFLIGAAVVGGIFALLKALGNTIKARYQKCVKVLYRMQKDFGTKETGMDTKAVLPGVGSVITDFCARLWRNIWFARPENKMSKANRKEKEKGALGIIPFVDNYVNEISGDYDEAMRAFNLIAAAGDSSTASQTSGAINNLSKRDHTAASNDTVSTSYMPTPSGEPVYESFADALKDTQLLNESQQVNESVLGTSILAASLLIRGISLMKGGFCFKTKDKNGNPVEKQVQVTKRSTREVCYAILNMFYGKYFDLNKVFSKMGINDFSDVDVNNVEKFEKVAIAFTKEQETSATSKMYIRVKGNYDKMVDGYLKIARAVVKNFKTYTLKKKLKGKDGSMKDLSEKDNNLLTAACEKLDAELNRQEDAYKKNFSRVLNAIVASEEYVKFCDFIIKRVIPVFKTGLAGDADYVLDVLPKTDEYYVVRQTGEQEGIESGDTAAGNVVLVKILNVEKEGNEGQGAGKKIFVTFSRVALIKDTKIDYTNLEVDLAGLSHDKYDFSAFANKRGEEGEATDTVRLPYGKWMAIDPRKANNVPGETKDKDDYTKTKLYKRTITNAAGENIDEYIFGEETSVKQEQGPTIDYNEDQNLSEAGENVEKAKANTYDEGGEQGGEQEAEEVPPTDNNATIWRLGAATVLAGKELLGDPKDSQMTCSFIVFGDKKCSAKDLDTKLKALNFEVIDNATKEKEHIVDAISNNLGITHVSKIGANDINTVENSLKVLELRETTGEHLKREAPKFGEKLKAVFDNSKIDPKTLTHAFSFAGNNGTYNFYTSEKATRDQGYYQNFDTEIKDARGDQVLFRYYPIALDSNNKIIEPTPEEVKNQKQQLKQGNEQLAQSQKVMKEKEAFLTGKGFALQDGQWIYAKDDSKSPALNSHYPDIVQAAKEYAEAAKVVQGGAPSKSVQNAAGVGVAITPETHGHGQKIPFMKWSVIDANAIATAFTELVDEMIKNHDLEADRNKETENVNNAELANEQPELKKESFKVEYSDMFNLAESFMGTLSYLKVNRTITTDVKNKGQYYVLSENSWGDGIIREPEKYLDNFVETSVKACETYDDFARLAKSSVSINFMPLTEDCSYKTKLPYNRFGMLTQSNPLYEATLIVSFNEDETVKNIVNLGISKIAK